MSVQRYRRNPIPAGSEELLAARYEPGQSLDDLRAVALMSGDEAEVIEAVFPSGKRVALAWFMRYPGGQAEPATVTVEPGGYLAYSSRNYSLYATDDANLRQFYDLAEG